MAVGARPTIILFIPRSGSSMVAGCFAACGAWFGECHEMRGLAPKGVYSNIAIDKWLKDIYGNRCRMVGPDEVDDGIEDVVRDFPPGWVFKCAFQYWRAFERFDPHWVVVWRGLPGILKSAEKFETHFTTGHGCKGTTEQILTKRQAAMTQFIHEHGANWVESSLVAAGNLMNLKDVVENCGFVWNHDAVMDFVEPELWHH